MRDIIIYCPTRFDQQILVKQQRIELGSNGPVLSLSNTVPTNGNGVMQPSLPQVEAAITASDMLLVHNIDKLLEEADDDGNSVDSLNGIHCDKGSAGDHAGTHALTQLPSLAVDDAVESNPCPTGGDYYIFWDYRACPVYKNENLCDIHANIVYLGELSYSLTHSLTHSHTHTHSYLLTHTN
jgi:hypothetical protein